MATQFFIETNENQKNLTSHLWFSEACVLNKVLSKPQLSQFCGANSKLELGSLEIRKQLNYNIFLEKIKLRELTDGKH